MFSRCLRTVAGDTTTARLLNRDTKNARIWLGLHFRRAMDDGNLIGWESADYVYGHHLRRVS